MTAAVFSAKLAKSPCPIMRKARIAQGAGLSQIQVNRFFKQFENAAKLAKRFSGKGGMENLMSMMSGARRNPR